MTDASTAAPAATHTANPQPPEAPMYARVNWRRNYGLGVANGVLYMAAETLLDPTLVLVSFLSLMTNSPLLLGLVVPLRDGTWYLPQVWLSGYLQSQPRKIDLYRRMSVLRITCWALVALSINLVRQPALLIASFLVAYTVASLASGLSGLPFLEVVGKTIPAERRGEFYAFRFGLGGAVSIAGSVLVRALLNPAGPLPFPYNYGLLAGLFFVLASLSLLLYNGVDEPPDTTLLPRAPLGSQVRRALGFLRADGSYRRLLALQTMMMIGSSATPFFAIYVQRALGGSRSMVGVYLAITMTTSLVFNPIFGRISRRFDNRRVMALAAMSGTLMSLAVAALALLAKPLGISSVAASWWLAPVFVLWGARNTASGVGSNSLLLDLAPAAERSLYIGFYNTLLGIVLLSTSISGLVVQKLGYVLLFVFTLVAHLAALYAATRLKQPERIDAW